MKRLIRRFAAWILTRTGAVSMVITPTCRCGHRFQVVFPDVSAVLYRAALANKPLLAAEVRSDATLEAEDCDAYRN